MYDPWNATQFIQELTDAGYRAIEMRTVRLAVGEVPEGVMSALEIEEMSRQFFGVEAMVVGPGLKSGMPILY